MEGNATNRTPSGTTVDEPHMNFPQRLVGVFVEPAKTFADVNRKPSWLGVFAIVCALTIASTYLLTNRMGSELMFRKALEMNPLARNLSEEQIQQAMARQQNSAFSKYSGYVGAPIGILVGMAAIAGAYLLVFMLMGASPGFKKSLAVTFWGYFPAGVVTALLGMGLMFMKDPETLEISAADNVASNLGPLVAAKEHPALHSLLASVDVFSVWTILLLSVGYSAVSQGQLTTKKAATGVVIVWVLWVLGKSGFKAIF